MMDYEKIQQIERDICFLYHELSGYRGIMGDLDYQNLYSKDYWSYIDVNMDAFVRQGCLVMAFAMVRDYVDGSGNYIEDKHGLFEEALQDFYPQSEEEIRLIDTVSDGLKLVASGACDIQTSDDFEEKSAWVYDTFVRGYFLYASK